MDIQLCKYEALGSALKEEMAQLRDARSIYDNPFFDLDFAGVLAAVRPDVRVLTARDSQGLLGFWALHARPDGWARPIGAVFSDWHGPVMRAEQPSLEPEQFLKAVGLKGINAPGLGTGAFAAGSGGVMSGVGIAHIPDGAEAYLARQKKLFPKQSRNLRRAERLIERDFGSMSIELDDTSAEAFEWLIKSKRAQYQRTGRHDVLGARWAQDMFETLRTKRYPRLRGRLSVLRFGGKIAAAEFDLLSDKVVHGWITVFDQQFASYSPGHLLMRGVICGMEASGHLSCDLGRDDHGYQKYYESYQLPVENTIIRTKPDNRLLARAWQAAEAHTSPRVSGVLTRMRRRGDQIFGTELDFPGRMRGLVSALRHV